MADKHINELEEAEQFRDESLLAAYQGNGTRKVPGRKIKEYVRGALDEYVHGAGFLLDVGRTHTGEPGTEAKVENTGTAEKPVLEFTLPRGEKGDTGGTGPKGDPFTYDDFTPEQLAALIGPQGPAGPAGGVTSVNGKTGEVTLTPKDIGAASAVDGDLDWGLIVGDTPKGNHVSFAFNKADKAIWAAAENDRGERQWNQCLYSNGNPQPSVEKLSTPHTINGVAFDGSADINVPAVKQTVFVSGGIANAIGGAYEGTGAAFVTEYVGGLAKIDFTITTVREEPAESPLIYRWGLNRDLLASKGAPMIEPILGGRILIFQNTGILDGHINYGGITFANSPFWVPARVYKTDGAVGAWQSSIMKTRWVIIGTVYGTVI